MPFHNLVLLVCASTFPWASLAVAQVPDSKPATANAALMYWQAFAQLPALNKDQEQILEDWDKAALDMKTRELLAASHASLMYLRRGAKLGHCDWGLDYNDGASLLLPHLAKARTLARLAALDARDKFEQGDWKAGTEDANAMMMLSRHVGSDPILVCLLVGYGIDGMATELLAPYLPGLNATHDQAVSIDRSLPGGATVEQAILTEKKFMAQWIIGKLKEAEQTRKGSWRELWNSVFNGPEIPDAVKQVDAFEKAVKLIEDLLPIYDELALLVTLPKAQFDAQYPTFVEKSRETSQGADALLPGMDKVLAAERRNQARRAMLLAALAVVRGGPDKLEDIKDPFGEGPFQYSARNRGFELKSKLLFDGQPVTLLVGQGKQVRKE